jgi:hypothetical protein
MTDELSTQLQSAATGPLLKAAFRQYAAKNQFKAKEVAYDHRNGFDVSGVSLMDVGELVLCLKGFRIIPEWLEETSLRRMFSQV